MGLSAVVYRNVSRLPMGADTSQALVEPNTGEVYFLDEALLKKHRGAEVEAVSFRLGNISEISALREEVLGILEPQSLLLQNVLYSGSHCGDTIPLELLAQLSAELARITDSPKLSTQLRRFVTNMEQLIQAARIEGNPIVFV